ncbi:MAG: WYL domain-containing protein [Armatimonadetes bacterium]|nr:WYL domain-containing protein [Armatimonadota bacterium]
MDDYYRVPLSTAEATVTVAVLRAVCALLQEPGVSSDIAPETLESAAARIEAEIPDFLAVSAEKLRPLLTEALAQANFVAGDSDTEGTSPLPLRIGRTRRLLGQAERSTGIAEIEYFVTSRNEWTTRRVQISDVYENEGGWYLEGECMLRRDHRMFKLEHIRAVRIVQDDDGEEELDPFDGEGNAGRRHSTQE